MENWKDIPGYEGLYQVSDCGRVKSLNYKLTKRERIMKLTESNRGYQRVFLYKEGTKKIFLVHRLVLNSFDPIQEDKWEVNHINGIKTDNRIENLERCTSSENQVHAYKNGLQRTRKVLQYDLQGNFIKAFDSITDAANETKVYYGNIVTCCRGKYKTAGGYRWEYCTN